MKNAISLSIKRCGIWKHAGEGIDGYFKQLLKNEITRKFMRLLLLVGLESA